MTAAYLPTVAPVLLALVFIGAAGVVSWRQARDRQVGPASDHGLGLHLNERSPASLAGNGASTSTPRQGAEL